MISAGMNPAQLSAASYGEFKPVAPNDSDASKSKKPRNRCQRSKGELHRTRL